jgi:hypothetical protein
MLLQAASGLEKFMVGNKNNTSLKDSNVAQISAYLYYQANVIASLEKNKIFQNQFKNILFTQIEKDFGFYIDAQARVNPKSLHHVYEWKKVGVPSARLFKLNTIGLPGMSFQLDYEFLDSKTYVPSSKSKRKYKFAKKAMIMEKGTPVIIAPSGSKRLVFEVNGYTVFMPKGVSVVVKSPGGGAATHRFTLAYNKFFSGQLVNESIKKSGFQQIFNSSMAKALKIPTSIKKVQYSFSPSTIRSQADYALANAFGGVL